jgi:hypothetical protein
MIIPIFPVSTTFKDESPEATLPRMALKLITPPTVPIISQDAAYQQLRLDNTLGVSPPSRPDDPLITDAAWAATEELDARFGWLGRALVQQQWQLALRRFPHGPILLPFPPMISVDSVVYEDPETGDDVTMTVGTDYRIGDEDDVAYIRPIYGKRWPRCREENGSVRITYTCGYATVGSPPGAPNVDLVPRLIRQYAKLRLGFYYENRETTVLERGVNVQDEFGFVAGMLENFRVRGVFRPWDPVGANG